MLCTSVMPQSYLQYFTRELVNLPPPPSEVYFQFSPLLETKNSLLLDATPSNKLFKTIDIPLKNLYTHVKYGLFGPNGRAVLVKYFLGPAGNRQPVKPNVQGTTCKESSLRKQVDYPGPTRSVFGAPGRGARGTIRGGRRRLEQASTRRQKQIR